MQKLKAFSLVELMVVIAIIGILAAYAVPAYKQYKIRAAITIAYVQLKGLNDALAAYYLQHSAYPTSIYYGGATINANANTTVSLPAISYIGYYTNTNGTYDSYWLQALINQSAAGISIPSNLCGNCKIFMAVFSNKTTNVTTTNCGVWATGDTGSVPLDYQPSTCTCTSIYSESSGTPAC
jgi:type IV pilus assembly protein PilA